MYKKRRDREERSYDSDGSLKLFRQFPTHC